MKSKRNQNGKILIFSSKYNDSGATVIKQISDHYVSTLLKLQFSTAPYSHDFRGE